MKASKFIPLIATLAFAILPACGTRGSVDEEILDTTNQQDTNNTTNSDLFDGYNAGNLFDTDLNEDPAPSTSSSQAQNIFTQPVPESVTSCVSSNSGLTFDANGYSTSGYSSSTPACFNQNQNQSTASSMYTANLFLAQDLQDIRFMRNCYNTIRSKRPKATMTITQRRIHFIVARMAMTRCFREVIRNQMHSFPWNQNIMASYGASDTMFRGLLEGYQQDLSQYYH